MDLWPLLLLALIGLHLLNRKDQRRRTARLAAQLQPWQIERLMQRLVQGYQTALSQPGPEAQAEAFRALELTEQQLAQEFSQVAASMGRMPVQDARTLKWALPGLEKFIPQISFDTRRVMQVHAEGIARVVANAQGLSAKDKAYRLLAEILLMQHSCHWYCRSRTIASARLLAQHQTRYEQALDGVSPETRQAYLAVNRGPAVGA